MFHIPLKQKLNNTIMSENIIVLIYFPRFLFLLFLCVEGIYKANTLKMNRMHADILTNLTQ